MRIETKRRIEAYTQYLPKMKERVAGAALMFIIAAIMMTSASFAWMSLSASPEVSSIKTTIAANGTLEIALVEGDGSQLPTSGRGDSSATDNNIVRSNVTWGNLVNLSDASYGINNIALRPALLHQDDLLNRPLRGAVYGTDGRISALNTDYTFAKWNGYEFLASTEKGVRAISAYELAVSEATAAAVQVGINRIQQQVSTALGAVNNQYKNSCWTDDNIKGLKSVLAAVMKGKIHDKLNGTTGTAEATDITEDLPKIYNLYKEFYTSMELQKTVYVEMANFQRYINALSKGDDTYNALTWEELSRDKAKYNRASVTATSTDGVVNLTGLTQFIADYTQAGKDLASLKTMKDNKENNGATYTFESIYSIMDRLVNTSSVTANGKTMSQIGTSEALGLLNNPELVLHNGYIYRFEQLAIMNGYRLDATMTIPINETYIITISSIKNAHLTTAATSPCYDETDMAQTSNQSIDLVPGDKIATDNYGLAIDFWIRTNAEKGYLVLEGESEVIEQVVRELGADGDGNQVELYIATINVNGTQTGVDVYKKGNKYYKNGTNEEVTPIGTPQEKYKTEKTVVGYDGVNRVWNGEDGKSLLNIESTTQGGGSSYIFYADSPEEQTKFLKLLESFRVAFVSSGGKLLATATMDTEEAYAVNGKVTVPLAIKDALTESVVQTVEDDNGELQEIVIKEPILDENGDPIYGITALERNQTIMITAIVYIDGTLLGNDDVLASSSIQGQLNLQFGTSTALNPSGNLELEAKERVLSATVNRDTFDFAVDDDISVDVTLTVEGDNPANISGFFQRAINATQGKRMDTVNFVRQRGEAWTAHFTFRSPGDYYLREVMLDGVNYRLVTPIHVTVTGFAPEYVFWGESSDEVTVYTASNKYIEEVGISFGSSGGVGQTDSVKMKFEGANGNFITSKMSYDYMQARWIGRAEFGTSSTYTLRYVEVNGEEYDLSQYNRNFVKTLTLYMGLTAEVTTTSSQRDFFAAGQTFPKDVKVEIFDNTGNVMPNLEEAVLTYSRGGSSTNTVTAPLTWDEVKNAYTGTLAITRAGSYKFLNILIGENKVTRATNSPTFTLKNPDPVSYNTLSASTYHGEDKIQFVPLTFDAYIGPIRINNSDTAFIEAVVTNSITGQDYLIQQSADSNKRGVIYYDAGSWYINLPTYRPELPDGSYGDITQDGTWTVKSISLWDVMDTDNVEHTDSNKLVWSDGVGGYDFSALSTTVSSTLSITMNAGTTDLGSSSTPFMTKHALAAESGMYLTLKDNTGRVIPASVIKDITLNLTYVGNTDTSYGYKVSSEYRPQLYVKLMVLDENTGNWTASVDPKLQYVGVYTVKNLIINLATLTQTIEPGDKGVPTQYTVTSQGPESNVKYEVRAGDTSSLGKTNGTVTGTFLQPQTPDIRVITRVTYEDENGIEQTAQYAIIENFGVRLSFAYKNGKTAPNGGGYTWSASDLEAFDMDLTKAETTSNGEVYKAGSASFLAGSYSVTGSILLNGTTVPINYAFPDITAYSITPAVKVSGVNPSPSTGITIYQPDESKSGYEKYKWENGTKVSVKNAYKDYFANLYMAAVENEEDDYGASADFTAPKLSLSLSNLGSQFTNATASISNGSGGNINFVFSTSTSKVEQAIGYTEEKTETLAEGECLGSVATVKYEIPYMVGTQTITSISVTSSGATYTVPLSNTVTIRQTNETPPSISFQNVIGYTLPETQFSEDGMAFTYVLPTDIGTKSETKTEATGNAEWAYQGEETQKIYIQSGDLGSETTTVTSGCSSSTKYYGIRNVTKYSRSIKTYTQTAGTSTYEVVNHVVGWIIDGVQYAPGQTITVSGQITATPVIGEKSRTKISEAVQNGTKRVIKDTSEGTQKLKTSSYYDTADQAKNNAKNLTLSGYTYVTSANPPELHTTEWETESWS